MKLTLLSLTVIWLIIAFLLGAIIKDQGDRLKIMLSDPCCEKAYENQKRINKLEKENKHLVRLLKERKGDKNENKLN